MRLIADPLSAEGGVARRAYAKLAALARSLGLPPAAEELARQAADVLLAGRPDGEPPSDFQEYTLLALVAAAARLAGAAGAGAPAAGPRGGAGLANGGLHSLPPDSPLVLAADARALAAAHGHDPDALEAVLEYVMAALNAYRALCDRVREAFGAAEDALAARAAGGGGPPPPHADERAASGAASTDLDGLASRLRELVAGDFARAAADAGPPEPGAVPALPPPPADVASSYEARAEYEAVASQIQATCGQIALLDRAHGLRVRYIQDEYGAHMERVRSLAQAAIDDANAAFQATRHGVTVHLDALVHLFQGRFFAGAAAAAAAAGGGGGGGNGNGEGGSAEGGSDGGGGGAGEGAPPPPQQQQQTGAAETEPGSDNGGSLLPGALTSQQAALAAHLSAPIVGGSLPLTRLSDEQMTDLAKRAAAGATTAAGATAAAGGDGGGDAGGDAKTSALPENSSSGGSGGGATPSKTAKVRAGGEERTVVIDADHAALLDAAAAAPARPRLPRGNGGGNGGADTPRSPTAAAAVPSSPFVGGAPGNAAAASSAATPATAAPLAAMVGSSGLGVVARENSLREWGAAGASALTGGAPPAGAGGGAARSPGSPFAFKAPSPDGSGAPPSPTKLPAEKK